MLQRPNAIYSAHPECNILSAYKHKGGQEHPRGKDGISAYHLISCIGYSRVKDG